MERVTTNQFQESFLNNDFLPPLPDAANVQEQEQEQEVQSSPESPTLYQSLTTPDQITALISNFSTSYNVVSISIILPILSTSSLYNSSLTNTTSSIVASSLIAGMIIGQLLGGAMGDLIGRKQGMMLVMFLQVIGSVGSASSYEGLGGWSIFEQLAIWRFMVGIGCGGVYPLAALLSSEAMLPLQLQAQSSEHHPPRQQHQHQHQHSHQRQGEIGMEDGAEAQLRKLKMLAATFSTQGIGFVTVPIVALGLLIVCGEGRLDIVWRMMLLFGSLPGIVLMFLRWKAMNAMRVPMTVSSNIDGNGDGGDERHANLRGHQDGEDGEQEGNASQVVEVDRDIGADTSASANTSARTRTNSGVLHTEEIHEKPSLWTAIKTEDQLFMKLIGTAGTWFLFDIVFYGNTLFQPVVIKTAFGYDDADDDNINDADEFSELVDNIRDSMILSAIALPGYFVAIALIGTRLCFKFIQTPRYIQIQGFAFMAIIYFIISEMWDVLTQHHWLLVFLYGSTFFFSNYGPNTTTFMLPSITFSPDCRSTLNGISAASGKAGALFGALMFQPISSKYGDAKVMQLCALTSVFAGIITMLCTKPPRTDGH